MSASASEMKSVVNAPADAEATQLVPGIQSGASYVQPDLRNKPATYDLIFIGAGCSVMQWLYAWKQHRTALAGNQEPQVLLIDKSESHAQRTWCFWENKPHLFDSLVSYRWSKLRFMSHQGGRVASIAPYSYQHIAGKDFFDKTSAELDDLPGITRLQAEVKYTRKSSGATEVLTDEGVFSANEVYSSVPDMQKVKAYSSQQDDGFPGLWQHFRGWYIETTHDAFNPETATLMDFRMLQQGAAVFFYVLPFSTRKALVECTVFGPDIWTEKAYDDRLHSYIRAHLLEGQPYTVYDTEQGSIPMSMADMRQFSYDGTTPLGTAAGMVKPSTGYMFKRSMLATATAFTHMIQSPVPHWSSPDRFAFYDRLLLGIIKDEPEQVARIMHELFMRNDFRQVFRFLDEESTAAEDARMFSKLPYTPFLKQLLKQQITRFSS
jgi:lycopene beta-cyclase